MNAKMFPRPAIALVIDDDEMTRMLVREILRADGLEVARIAPASL